MKVSAVGSQMVATSPAALRKALKAYLEAIPNWDPKPQFRFVVGWCETYEALFERSVVETTAIPELADRAFASGRVLLSARGGAAKSVILRRLAYELVRDDESVVAMVDVTRWSSAHYEQWRARRGSAERMDMLLAISGCAEFSVRSLEVLKPNVRRIILVDGLNEVASGVGSEIINVLDEYIRYAPSSGVVVADRLVRRDIDVARWNLATIEPLSEEEIRTQLQLAFQSTARYDDADPATKELLATPYFLNALLQDKSATQHTSSGTILGDFQTTLSDEEIDIVSAAAYRLYEEYKSRTFDLERFRELAGEAIVQRLVEAGSLVQVQGLASFDHHLKHDFLASRYLVSMQSTDGWTDEAFDVITFNASSFDALSMALQQLPDTSRADLFIGRVYDWNLYGVAYALTEGRTFEEGALPVSSEMQTAVVAMLALRLFDTFELTVQRTADALSLFPADTRPFVAVTSIDELIAEVMRVPAKSAWFSQWQALFSKRARESIERPELEVIRNPNSLLGWTVANVARRVGLGSSLQALLRDWLPISESAVVRWRIAHALGAFPSAENMVALFDRLDKDQWPWVRYGSVRSLIEIAAKDSDGSLRACVFNQIVNRVGSLSADARTVGEFQRALFVRDAPKGWLDALAPALERFYDVETSFERRQEWRKLAARLETRYSTNGDDDSGT